MWLFPFLHLAVADHVVIPICPVCNFVKSTLRALAKMAGFGHFSEPPLFTCLYREIGICFIEKLNFHWIFFSSNIGLTSLSNPTEFNSVFWPKIANSRQLRQPALIVSILL
jgi:hypothetical protein